MPTSFGGRRNFTSWGVTLSCPPGAEQNLCFNIVNILKVLLTEAFDVVDSIDHDEAVGVVILYNVLGGEVCNSWL